MADFKNDSGLEFRDISTELYREYTFDSGVIRINAPLKLHVSDNGHRVFDNSGKSHYVPLGWIHLQWEVEEGKANFVL